MEDILGQAILDFQTGNSPENIVTQTSISDADVMETSYLFRAYKQMPAIEQKALDAAFGTVLDVGCGAGSHSLYLKQRRNLNVLPIDISPKAIEACRLRGLENATVSNIMDCDGCFDTILLLMNGTGIFGRMSEVSKYLRKLKTLLNPGGQILIDSSDIIYMFDEDDDGAKWIPGGNYYGELSYTVSYKGRSSNFDWLYLDYNTLQNAAHANGLNCELMLEGEHFEYLARLTAES